MCPYGFEIYKMIYKTNFPCAVENQRILICVLRTIALVLIYAANSGFPFKSINEMDILKLPSRDKNPKKTDFANSEDKKYSGD